MKIRLCHVLTVPGFNKRGGFCRGGGEAWFLRYGFDWADFVLNGIESEILINTGDALAYAVVEWAIQRSGRKHGVE